MAVFDEHDWDLKVACTNDRETKETWFHSWYECTRCGVRCETNQPWFPEGPCTTSIEQEN